MNPINTPLIPQGGLVQGGFFEEGRSGTGNTLLPSLIDPDPETPQFRATPLFGNDYHS